jgi:hypothetical protein
MVSSRNLARDGDRDLEMTDFHPTEPFAVTSVNGRCGV